VEWYEAGHPIPDDRSVTAATRALAVARSTDKTDMLVVLLSGGASAMMSLPAGELTLADKQITIQTLLREGADITELNTVRKHLSAIKGGHLAAVASGSLLTLAVSDVVGDDLSVIGSGPTMPDFTTFAGALEVLGRHGGRERYPRAVLRRLEQGTSGAIEETPKAGDPRLARSMARVIGGRRTAVAGARAAAESLGYVVHVMEEPVTGKARVAGHALIEAARVLSAPRPLCILSSGETTVRVTGRGKGGRNQECALGMVRALESLGSSVVAASIGTDGVDGPTDAAGAIVDSTTLARAEGADVGPPERYLNDNNAYVFFDELNDLIQIGPTNTNVGDLQVILVT
jgi:hydroxypyruvate reductase